MAAGFCRRCWVWTNIHGDWIQRNGNINNDPRYLSKYEYAQSPSKLLQPRLLLTTDGRFFLWFFGLRSRAPLSTGRLRIQCFLQHLQRFLILTPGKTCGTITGKHGIKRRNPAFSIHKINTTAVPSNDTTPAATSHASEGNARPVSAACRPAFQLMLDGHGLEWCVWICVVIHQISPNAHI